MNEETKKAFSKYEDLKIQEKEIKTKIDELKPIIINAIPEETEIDGEHGYFSVQPRSKWKHSSALEAKEKSLKEEKKKEIAEGIAIETKTPVLFYRQEKK